ncbi:pentapeptide repeat-containing protein [Paenibacillus lentus]|uniref:pentapeptide repeat-containing protein n=1 Tax=Paenibacillus lentus TaxID=1338368 RepID=UPI0013DE00BC|nr:pentapeptide repeat-containing protein [Paenibacillus lentus]
MTIDSLEQQIAPLREAMLQAVDAYWPNRMDMHRGELIEAFRKLCIRIGQQQSSGQKAPIAYIHFSFLRTWLLQDRVIYSIEAYDDRWYVDRNECLELLELPWLYPLLQSFKQDLGHALFRQVPDTEIDAIVLREFTVLHQYIREWIRSLVPELIALPEFLAIERADVLRIRAGEFKDFSEQLWMEDCTDRQAAELKSWLEEKRSSDCMNSDLRGLDLSGGQYEGIDLRYSHCSGGDFSGSNFQGSICVGTDFSGSKLTGADFSQSLLYDANFSGCDLSSAKLAEAVGGARFFHEGMVLGFYGIDFSNANLQGANLLFADLAGAEFQGANLSGALILKQDALQWNLSEEQRRSITWMEEDESGVPVPVQVQLRE